MDSWKRDLEQRAAKAPLINRYRPTPEMPKRVDMNDEDSRAIRETFQAINRARSQTIIIWLSVGLVCSAVGNAMQFGLYLKAIKILCK